MWEEFHRYRSSGTSAIEPSGKPGLTSEVLSALGPDPDLVHQRGRVETDSDFERFYENETRRVFATVFLLCRDRAMAEDATQEAFARAFERWGRLRSQPWAGGWVTTTALNLARRALRNPRGMAGTTEQQDPLDPIEIWASVRALPRRQQEAVVLHYRLDLPVAEIAQILGCREGTVRTHLARARERLRKALREDSDEG